MRKKYFIVTFETGHKYNGCYTKVAGQTIDEARDKFRAITPYYDRIFSSMVIAGVKERDLKYIPLKTIIKKEREDLLNEMEDAGIEIIRY